MPAADASLPPFEGWLEQRPELRRLYKRFYGALWDEGLLPRDVLELCRLRIARMHECEAELAVRDVEAGITDEQLDRLETFESADCFSDAQKAALRIAEKMPYAHHAILDEEYEHLRRYFDEPQVVALTVALALIDTNCRLRLVFELPPSPSTDPASVAGPLH